MFTMDDKNLFTHLMNVFTKSNQMLNIIYQSNVENYRKQVKKMSTMT